MRGKHTKILGIEVEKSTPLYYIIIAAVIFIGYRLYKYIREAIAAADAKKKGEQLYQQNNPATQIPNPQTGEVARSTQFLTSIADTIKNEVEAFNQDEELIVSKLNELNNGTEVSIVSAYYRAAYSRSLKSDVEKALDSSWNILGAFRNTEWKDLKDYVQKFLS